jgi:hypothetical protein
LVTEHTLRLGLSPEHISRATVKVAAGACTGENAKDATAAVVGKAIEVGKGTATGIASGVEEGRKSAESVDGAVVVSNADELGKNGGAKVGEVTASGAGSRVTVLFENTGEKPMRVTHIDVLALDKDGVVIPTTIIEGTEVTVPAKAKAKYQFAANGAPDQVKTVRIYGKDIPSN